MQVHPIFLDFVQSYQQPAYRYWLRFQSTLPARGATAACRCKFCKTCKFQSTLPARGATGAGQGRPVHYAGDFNPRSPRGERPCHWAPEFYCAMIFQSTLPARGATWRRPSFGRGIPVFQSTLPARGATDTSRTTPFSTSISIHAPREGSDGGQHHIAVGVNISIHAPREGSDQCAASLYRTAKISIHAPREGSDSPCHACRRRTEHFNPRSPRGERRRPAPRTHPRPYFNPRSPRGERLRRRSWPSGRSSISIHAPREGSDPPGAP